MSNPETPETQNISETTESFGDILSQFQKSHSRKTEGSKQLQATVIAINAESVFFDIGYKSEGILPLPGTCPRASGSPLAAPFYGQGPRSGWLLRAFALQGRTAHGLDGSGKSFCRQNDRPGNRDGRDQRRLQRRRRRAGVHARLAQWSSRRGRDGEVGRAGNPLPHHQARRHG